MKLANQLIAEAEKIFAKELDIRYWSYLDLIIFFFETRNEVTLDKALNYVDNEKNFGNLSKKLEEAVVEIKQTVLYSTGIIGDILHAGFSMIASDMRAMRGELSNIATINQQALVQAAQVKQNTSSKQMMEDIQSIRNDMRYISNQQRIKNHVPMV